MKKRAVVYPYQKDFKLIMERKEFKEKYDVKALITVRHLLMENEKTHNDATSCRVQDFDSFIQGNEEFDVLIVPDFWVDEKMEEYYVNRIITLLSRSKELLCCKFVSNENQNKIEDWCKQKDKVAKFLNSRKMNQKKRALKVLDVPIIAVAGCWDDIDKLEILMKLGDSLKERGYSVSQIGGSEFVEIVGLHSFPWNIIDAQIPEEEKVYLLNSYVKDIILREQPDVLIFGVPGAIQCASWEYTGGFGIVPYLVFQALSVDYMIISTFFCDYSDEFITQLDKVCEYKFGVPIDCVHLAKVLFEPSSINQTATTRINNLKWEQMDEALKSFSGGIPVRDLTQHVQLETTVDDFIEKCSF